MKNQTFSISKIFSNNHLRVRILSSSNNNNGNYNNGNINNSNNNGCVSPTVKFNGICSTCPEAYSGTKDYYYNNNCVKDCSEYYREVTDQNICSMCTNNKYFSKVDNACVKTCPNNLIKDKKNNSCINCKLDGENGKGFFYNGKCVNDCPKNTIVFDASTNACGKLCDPDYFDATTNTCVSTCSVFLIPNNKFPKKCDNCNTLDYGYSYNNTCVAGSSCPPGTTLVNEERNGCVYSTPSNNDTSNTSNNTLMENTDKCSINSYYNVSSNECFSCYSHNLYIIYKDNKCISECPSNTSVLSFEKVCFTDNCKLINKVEYNKQCLDSCPNSTNLNVVINSCETYVESEQYKLTQKIPSEITEEQIKVFQDLAKNQVKLAELGTIPLEPKLLNSLDFAYSLEM